VAADALRCDGAGIRFARGSRRAMVAASLRRLVRRDAGGDDPSAFWALRGVSFRAPEASCIGVCGGNGAGKTTLLRLLAGIYAPDEGTVHVAGRTATLLSLGAGINAHLSGRENVFVAGAVHGLSARAVRARYDEIAAFAELDARTLATPVRYYSAGMRTRLGFAIATSLAPEVLLLDEVLATGDGAFRRKSAARLRELLAAARCVVLTSHNLDFLREHAQHALWLDRGRQVAFGPASEVLAAYERSTK
jgi:ABC-2 type transport system ATP-binding protein